MRIEGILWLRSVVDKLASKHSVEPHEVKEVLESKPKYRFLEKGERKGEDVYAAFGRTGAGRYLTVIFIYKQSKDALILSGRDMVHWERKNYEKK